MAGSLERPRSLCFGLDLPEFESERSSSHFFAPDKNNFPVGWMILKVRFVQVPQLFLTINKSDKKVKLKEIQSLENSHCQSYTRPTESLSGNEDY